MLNALDFLINTFASLFCAALFIRAGIFWRRIPAFNPYCSFIYRITDFIVIPVRKLISSSNHIDFPSLLIAYIICALQLFLSIKIKQASLNDIFKDISINFALLPVEAIYMFLYRLLSTIFSMGFLYAVLSWISPFAPLMSFLRSLIEPILATIRQIMPKAIRNAPIDLSLMFLMITIIALQMIITQLLS